MRAVVRLAFVAALACALGCAWYVTCHVSPRHAWRIAPRLARAVLVDASGSNDGRRLRHARLQGTRWPGRASFRGADLRHAVLERAIWDGADLTGANLAWSNLRSSSLRHARLQDALGHFARAERVDLTGATCRGADLSGARLRGARLAGTDLSGARLFDADLSEADLTGAVLKDARYSSRTRFPAGFLPEAHGALLVPRDELPAPWRALALGAASP